jgi:flagellar hook-basal body complex protein FliE
MDGISTIASLSSQPTVLTVPGPTGAATSAGPVEDFGEILGRMATDAIDVVKTGEGAAIQGLKAELSPLSVVNSVMAAQQSLHAVLAIRDKAVAAYQDIARMTI